MDPGEFLLRVEVRLAEEGYRFSAATRAGLSRAWELAREHGERELTHGDLLLGLLSVPGTRLAEAHELAGIDPDRLAEVVARLRRPGRPPQRARAVEVHHLWNWWTLPRPRLIQEHFLLAALDQGRPGAIMARALGHDPAQLQARIMERLRASPRGRLEADTGPGAWAHTVVNEWFFWKELLDDPEGQGARMLSECGLDLEAALAWVSRESPDLRSRESPPHPLEDPSDLSGRARELVKLFGTLELEPEHLFATLASEEVGRLYWPLGCLMPLAGWEHAMGGTVFLRLPGGLEAMQTHTALIQPPHFLLALLRQPRFQLEFSSALRLLREELEGDLEEVRASDLRLSPEATTVLTRGLDLCADLNVEPGPLPMGLVALEVDHDRIARVLAGVDLTALRERFDRLVRGTLPPGDYAVNGVRLGAPGGRQGALERLGFEEWRSSSGAEMTLDSAGRVVSVSGTELEREGRLLIGSEARYDEAERLVGEGRIKRWIPLGEGFLRVDADHNGVSAVHLCR